MPIEDAERERRRDLLRAHLDAENAGGLDAVMATFATDAITLYNAIPFATPEAIRGAHEYKGVLSNCRSSPSTNSTQAAN